MSPRTAAILSLVCVVGAVVVVVLTSLDSLNRVIADGKADGAQVFREVCARCHGDKGVPDVGQVARLGVKDLTEPGLHARLSDAEIAAQIRNGSKNMNMPSFTGVLTDEQIRAVIAHVRELKSF